jgi:PAS domain S-box-containing protein
VDAHDMSTLDDERFRILFERSQVAMSFISVDGTVLAVNEAACEFLGRTRADLIGRSATELIHPDDRPASAANMAALRDGAVDSFRVERRFMRGDGTVLWGDSSSQVIRGPDGAARYWQTVIVDITERELEQAKFSAVLEAAPDAIIGVDHTDHIALVNARAEALFGHKRELLVGASVETLFPEYVQAVQSGRRNRISTGLEQGETVVAEIAGRRRDGTDFPAEVSLSIVETARGRMVLAGIRDGTERRQAAIVQSSMSAIIGRSLSGEITSWNSGAETMYGYTSAEALGHDLAALIPDDRRDELPSNTAKMVKGASIAAFETQRVRKDGSVLDVSVTMSPIRDGAGVVVGSSTVAHDITEMKHELLALQNERQALADRLQQSQRLEGLGQLAGGVAHDFNNLLAVILNYASFVAEQTVGDDAVQADIKHIRDAATRAAELTRQLLIFGRRETIRPEILDLNSVIADVHTLLARSIGEHVEIVVEADPAFMAIKADRGQIEQALVNLAVNARDAMRSGGTLTIETRHTVLDDEYCRVHPEVRPGVFAELSVSDTGTGIPAGVMTHIFEPFFTTKPRGESTGLGLATVYGIVTETGGTISVYSEEGIGTTFRLFFPAIDQVAVASGREVSAKKPAGVGHVILVVEDEPAMMEVTARLLRRNGYTVLESPTGARALELAAQNEVHLLLTDSVMPHMSGRELAERMKHVRPDLPVLFMSGYSHGVLGPQRILDEGVALIQKPFNEEELLDYIRRSLTRDLA